MRNEQEIKDKIQEIKELKKGHFDRFAEYVKNTGGGVWPGAHEAFVNQQLQLDYGKTLFEWVLNETKKKDN